jgi:hypothetical protein
VVAAVTAAVAVVAAADVDTDNKDRLYRNVNELPRVGLIAELFMVCRFATFVLRQQLRNDWKAGAEGSLRPGFLVGHIDIPDIFLRPVDDHA